MLTNEKDLTQHFNNYFVNVASKLKEPNVNAEFEHLNTFVQSKVPSNVEFKIPLTNVGFVRNFLSNLNVSKATGLDNIGPKILKISANIIAPSLVYIINKSIISGSFPSMWKEAKVKPLFKSGDKDDINNYRPISILPTISKLIEKWVDINFSLFLNNYELLHKSQSGFRAKHSTESAFILMVDSWLKALNAGKLIGCVMVDDLPLTLHDTISCIDLYADDTTIYEQNVDMSTLQSNLQKSLNLLHEWCRQNGMVLNTLKTKVMLITSRQKRNNLHECALSLKYNDIDIKMTTSDKILGVHVDENLSWNDHYRHVSKKVSSYLWLLSKIKTYLPQEHRLLYYNSYIKPQFDYFSIIWSNSSNFNVNKINKLQRRACKLILLNDYNSLSESLDQLDILSFDQGVFLNKAKIMYKIHNNLAPSYLHEMFQMRAVNLEKHTIKFKIGRK